MNNERPVNLLRGRRSALGLSQADVAAHLHKTQSWYSLIEIGRLEPSADDKSKLATLLKCRVTDIFPKRAA